jgi:hypothetical protein
VWMRGEGASSPKEPFVVFCAARRVIIAHCANLKSGHGARLGF